MHHQPRFHFGVSLFIGLAWGELVGAQEPPAVPQQPPPVQQVLEEEASKNVAVPCVEPPPLVSLRDYNGPLKKTVGVFARALERKSVHPPHYKRGVELCSLELKGKFVLFVQDSLDPVTFLSSGFWAGMDQASDRDPTFRTGRLGLWQALRSELCRSGIVKILRGLCLSRDLFRRPALLPASAWQRREAFSSRGRTRVCGSPRRWHALAELIPSGWERRALLP